MWKPKIINANSPAPNIRKLRLKTPFLLCSFLFVMAIKDITAFKTLLFQMHTSVWHFYLKVVKQNTEWMEWKKRLFYEKGTIMNVKIRKQCVKKLDLRNIKLFCFHLLMYILLSLLQYILFSIRSDLEKLGIMC